ncbi:methyl-accepting chemotaxis protein [Sphingomonas sp. Leaf4]|uniref:methyl-accepting chemotaxis protein n=1 Tax=Sphingomonas sp. Leaf4 TaxID=2876553 RepID=UPI001E5C9FA8|nr:methyl-accepting chemotaxis protein [Sphingomonas sp. Leaf4]
MQSLPIGKRIAGAFGVLTLSVLLMIGILWWALDRIGTTSADSVRAQDIHSEAQAMEAAMLAQNSQMRGFIIAGDPQNIADYREAVDRERKAADALGQLLAGDATAQRDIVETRQRMDEWRRQLIDPVIALARTDSEAGRRLLLGRNEWAVRFWVDTVTPPLHAVRDAQGATMQQVRLARTEAMHTGMLTLLVGGIALVAATIVLSILLARSLARPIVRLTDEMEALATGDHGVAVADATRGDEIGAMSRAVLVFRDAAVAKAQADAEQQLVVDRVGAALARLSAFDLRARLHGFPPAYATLERDFNASVAQLGQAIASVRDGTSGIVENTAEMQAATDDLARRAEQQAASLEETSAAINEMSDTVRENAVQARSAQDVAGKAREDVKESEEIVRRTVAAIGDIERSSNEIAEIISLIDGLSFQTNLLALNAGVEAARAGDAGKGFAVVASEVRALAERSADAARDINQRITATVGRVRNGVDLARQTDESLRGIATDINQIATFVTAIAGSASEQAATIQQINTAIGEMDSVTQSNAAMIEEINAAVGALGDETATLDAQVGRFVVDDAPAPAAPVAQVVPLRATRPMAPPPPPKRVARPVRGNTAIKADEDDWSSF